MSLQALRKILLSITAGYLAIVATFCVVQRDLIYHPSKDGKETPAAYNTQFNEVRIKNTLNSELQAWWIPQAEPSSSPALLYCHGNGATLSRLSHVASIFHQMGVNALIFDYRGFGRSDPAPDGLSQEALVSDAQAAYEWIKRNGFEEERILIWGHSLGAAVALQIAANNSPQALVLEGAFSSIEEMGRYRYPWLLIPSFLIWDKFDNLQAVTKIKSRLLVMHAENDTVIPTFMGLKVFDQARVPKQFMLLKSIDHNDFPNVYREYKESIMKFFGTTPAASTPQISR